MRKRALPVPLAVTALAASVLLGGCGGGSARDVAGGPSSGSSTGHPAVLFPGCPADAPAVRRARALVRADLDGDGHTETVKVTGPGRGPCADALVAAVDGRTVGVSLRETGVDAPTAAAVAPTPGGRQLVFVRGNTVPRGGFQPHLVALAGGRLQEVTDQGNPLLPFVASDGGGEPVTADCAPGGGVAVVSATVHEPPGIVLAWDVRRTTYALHGADAEKTSSAAVARAVADPTLRRQMPELFGPRFFSGCTVATASR